MQEFRQYPHYMQPRIHKMMQEVRACCVPLLMLHCPVLAFF